MSEEKDLLAFATKLIEQIPDSTNTKEYYQSYLLRKKQTGKMWKIIAQLSKTIENKDIADKK